MNAKAHIAHAHPELIGKITDADFVEESRSDRVPYWGCAPRRPCSMANSAAPARVDTAALR